MLKPLLYMLRYFISYTCICSIEVMRVGNSRTVLRCPESVILFVQDLKIAQMIRKTSQIKL